MFVTGRKGFEDGEFCNSHQPHQCALFSGTGLGWGSATACSSADLEIGWLQDSKIQQNVQGIAEISASAL